MNRSLVFVFAVLLLIGITGNSSANERNHAEATADSLRSIFELQSGDEVGIDSTTTLDDYLMLALKRSPALRAAYFNWIAELRKTDAAGALPDPKFSYGYFIENVETRVGPQEHRFSLRQAFPWFGTLGAMEDVAFAQAQAAEQRFESERQRLFYEIKAAYYDLYRLGQDIRITRENFELLTFWEKVARAKYKVGLKQYPDVIKAQVELGKLEDQIQSLNERREPLAARLRAALDLPADTKIPIPTSLEFSETTLDDDEVIETVVRENPDLRALNFLVEKAEAGVDLAHKKTLPSFSLGVDYIATGDALDPTLPESGKDPWVVGASISLPIWFGKNKAQRQEAEARKRSAEYRKEESENRLIAYAENVLFAQSDALRKTKLYRDGLVPKAEQALNATYSAYQAGEADFLELLDAQRELLKFQLTVEHEKVNLAKALAELEMLTNSRIEEFQINNRNQGTSN